MSLTKTELKDKQAKYTELKNDFTHRWLDTVITKADSPRRMESELKNLMPQGMIQLVLIHLSAQLSSHPQAEEIYEAVWSVHSDLHNKMQEDLISSRGFPRLKAKAEASRIIDSTLDWAAENIRHLLNIPIIADSLPQALLRPEQFAEQFKAAKHATWPEQLRNAYTSCRRALLRQS